MYFYFFYFFQFSTCTCSGSAFHFIHFMFKLATATLLAHGAAGRKLVSCNTADIASCFANSINGGDIDLIPGTMSSTDAINAEFRLSLQGKYASIACMDEDGETCVWQGFPGYSVVYIANNGGTTTLSSIIIFDGDAGSGNGGGLYVHNAIVDLILIDFIDNYATYAGALMVSVTSTVTLQGCTFEGNTAGGGFEPGGARDVYNNDETVVISGCPSGEDKPTCPSPPSVFPPH